jgi:hypothetical protein
MKSVENAVIWQPLEIRLTSSNNYGNPYLECEINAVFTHESGEEIKVPGFWYEHNTWAVRFTPTKLGKWDYTVTSTVDDEGLNALGSFEAGENDGATDARKHGFVTEKNNNRYFTYADGTPFLWMGDTHWQAPNYETITDCNYPYCDCKNQFKHEVDNRLAKGFNVYQTYFDSGENDGGGQKGLLPSLWALKYRMPASEQFNKKIDVMFEYLDQVGMCAAVGFGVHIYTVQAMPQVDLFRFVRYIIARYGCYNVVWITAQEITRLKPAHDESKTVMDVYMELGQYISEIDGYHHSLSTHMDVMDVDDERAQRLANAAWHTFWETQGGHMIKMTPKKSHYRDYIASKGDCYKPVIEGELSYEDINCGGFSGNKACRVAGWNAVMNGCAGYTYGVAGIWANGYSTEKSKGWIGETSSYSYDPWYMGLDKPGSFEMKYLVKFITAIPEWYTLEPSYYDTALGDFLESEQKLMMRKGNDTVLCYFRNDDLTTGAVLQLDESKAYNAMWFNVYTGNYIFIEKFTGKSEYAIGDKPSTEDWALVITVLDLDVTFEEFNKVLEFNAGNEIKPVSVQAIGGICYKDGKMVDNTANLYDDTDSVWMPYSNRSTQTVIYDLGKDCEIGGIALVPNENTALPAFRVEASNDGDKWFMVVNTQAEGSIRHEGEVKRGLNISARYVKIVMFNAVDISEEDKDNVSFKLFENEYATPRIGRPWYYPKTEIKKIAVYEKK